MKKITIAIIICAAVFVFFGALSAWALSSYDYNKINDRDWRFGNIIGWHFWSDFADNWGDYEDHSIDKTLQADGIDLSSISISSVSSDITITEGNNISARLYGDYSSKGEIDLVMTEVGGSLNFNVEYPNNLGIRRSDLKLDVTIPAKYASDININTISGAINITLPENKFIDISISTTSGDIRTGSITADNLKFSTISGDIYSDVLSINDVSSNTTSGELDIDMLYGTLDAVTISGDIRLNTDASGDCKINTTSGKVDMGVPPDARIVVDYKTVSGDFNSGIPITYESSSRNSFRGYTDKNGNEIKIDTISGDFNLNTIG